MCTFAAALVVAARMGPQSVLRTCGVSSLRSCPFGSVASQVGMDAMRALCRRSRRCPHGANLYGKISAGSFFGGQHRSLECFTGCFMPVTRAGTWSPRVRLLRQRAQHVHWPWKPSAIRLRAICPVFETGLTGIPCPRSRATRGCSRSCHHRRPGTCSEHAASVCRLRATLERDRSSLLCEMGGTDQRDTRRNFGVRTCGVLAPGAVHGSAAMRQIEATSQRVHMPAGESLRGQYHPRLVATVLFERTSEGSDAL